MPNEVRIKLTDAQRAKIKSATGKDMSEIRVGSVGNNPAVSNSKKTISARAARADISARATRADISARAARADISARAARADISARAARADISARSTRDSGGDGN